MKIIHICDGWEKWNGAANIARLIGEEQSAAGHQVTFERFAAEEDLKSADEVWVHCGWMPCLWRAVRIATSVKGVKRPKVRWMPEACYDPVRLRYSWFKKFVAGLLFERRMLRKCDALVATCDAEADWIRAYLGKKCPPIEIQDITRFFNLSRVDVEKGRDDSHKEHRDHKELRVLYLGRKHPLKGIEYFEKAVYEINSHREYINHKDSLGSLCSLWPIELHVVSNKFGTEKEAEWDWCDVLCLPTLSDNLGLVIAEALERGKYVVTTDGAPAWRDYFAAHHDRGIYLEGYREGDDKTRVQLLVDAIRNCLE